MQWSGDMPCWGGHWFGGLFVLVFWILVAAGIFFLVRGLTSRSGTDGQAAHPESALEILKRRYAKGEIGKDEFEEKKKALTE